MPLCRHTSKVLRCLHLRSASLRLARRSASSARSWERASASSSSSSSLAASSAAISSGDLRTVPPPSVPPSVPPSASAPSSSSGVYVLGANRHRAKLEGSKRGRSDSLSPVVTERTIQVSSSPSSMGSDAPPPPPPLPFFLFLLRSAMPARRRCLRTSLPCSSTNSGVSMPSVTARTMASWTSLGWTDLWRRPR